jgi:hypothetical protein
MRRRRETGRSRYTFLGVTIELEQLERINALAAADERTRSWVVRKLLAKGLAQMARTQAVAR